MGSACNAKLKGRDSITELNRSDDCDGDIVKVTRVLSYYNMLACVAAASLNGGDREVFPN